MERAGIKTKVVGEEKYKQALREDTVYKAAWMLKEDLFQKGKACVLLKRLIATGDFIPRRYRDRSA